MPIFYIEWLGKPWQLWGGPVAADNFSEDYEFEYYEKYVGGEREVKRKIENCPKCGSKLFITHSSDQKNLLTREIARCRECNYGQRKILHGLH